jgi:NAD(P)H dehydrogenase (quinone)
MQNLLWQRASIANDGKIAMSLGEGRLGLVDTRDIADVATRVLLDSSWDFGTYEITGPESLTFADMAAVLTKVLRKEITYVPLPLAPVEPSAPWVDRTLHDYSAAYAANWGDYTSVLVEKITGKKPRTFEAFARELLAPTLLAEGELATARV